MLHRRDGKPFWSDMALSPVQNGVGEVTHFLCFYTDVSARKRLEKEIMEISEREQRRIGQDLHDDLGQQLTGIELLSNVLEQKLAAKSSAEAADAAQITILVNQAITKARILARGLSPLELQTNDFVSALQELASQTENLFGIACRVSCEVPIFMRDGATATHLYRIAQEAINNAIKHGKAQQVVMSLTPRHDHLILTVKDDGMGLPDEVEKAKDMGLSIMRYRANVIGAKLDIQRVAGGGTRVIRALPAIGISTEGEKTWSDPRCAT